MVEHDRHAHDGGVAGERGLDLPGEPPVGESDGASSDGAGPADAIVSAAQAPRSAQAPPRSDVSAAVTQTTRSASSSAPCTRTGCRSAELERSELGARRVVDLDRAVKVARLHWGGGLPRRRSCPARRSRPPAKRIVCLLGAASRAARAGRSRRRPPAGAGRSGRPGAAASEARRRSRHARRASRDRRAAGPRAGSEAPRRPPPRCLVADRAAPAGAGAARRRRPRRAACGSPRGEECASRAHPINTSRRAVRRSRDAGGRTSAASRAAARCATRGGSSRASR